MRDLVVKPVRREAEMPGDAGQDARANGIERGIKRAERLVKLGNLAWPDIGRHALRQRAALGQIAADMPEFLEVILARALGDLGAEGGVAALATATGDEIGALRVHRQREELPRERPAFCDKIGVHAVVAHHGEAILAEAGADRLGKGIGVERFEREDGNLLKLCCKGHIKSHMTNGDVADMIRPSCSCCHP